MLGMGLQQLSIFEKLLSLWPILTIVMPNALVQVSLIEALLVYTLAGQACKNLNLI